MKKFLLYLIRWEMSTFTLAPVISLLAIYGITNSWIAAFTGNFIGACIFFWVDRWIFKSNAFEIWNIRENGICDRCNKKSEILYRLVRAPGYNKVNSEPLFLCMECSKEKTEELRNRGVDVKGRSK